MEFSPLGEHWKLLTPVNIQIKRAWPWSRSIQKIVDSGEPLPRQSSNLMIASDYAGDYSRASHRVYSFLVIKSGVPQWLAATQEARRKFLSRGRTMSYKRLDDSQRQQALVPYLLGASRLDGHLVTLAVDKRKKWLSTSPEAVSDIKKAFGLTASWNPRSLEEMMRKVQFFAILASIWSGPLTNITWITDEDEFVINDRRHDDALHMAGRMSSAYTPQQMGILRLNTTGQDPDVTNFEDLCAIPDLAAGMLSEVSTGLPHGLSWQNGGLEALDGGLSQKAGIIADWFWDQDMTLRKTFIVIDAEGDRYGVRKVSMM